MLTANPAVAEGKPYKVPRSQAPTDLVLDGNEGPKPSEGDLFAPNPAVVQRYPNARPLEALLAKRFGVDPDQVLVSAGGDDLLDRCCRAMLNPSRALVLPVPGFAMTRRYAELAGAPVVEIPWNKEFPADECIRVANLGIIVLTSPNNPTGAVGTVGDVDRICAERPSSLCVLDAAYAEFADVDLTQAALRWPNAVVIRTLSKAWGLAGLRVGYAIGSVEVIGWLRAAGAPYPVSGPSLELAMSRVRDGVAEMESFVRTARAERTEIERTLRDLGAQVSPSQGNFAFGRVSDSTWLRDAMAGLGIAIRAFPGRDYLEDAVRISIPGDSEALDRVCSGLRAALRPQALMLDLDGVVADVRGSYRAAILETAKVFGVVLTAEQVVDAKRAGDANNDWVLTRRLLAAAGVVVSLQEVTDTFESLVQGTEQQPGLWTQESLFVSRDVLAQLAAWRPLAAVTGRPRVDAERFLKTQGIADLFDVVVCMEDAAAKPDPAPVVEALRQLGVTSAWMVGDTPDDARAARAAGVVPIGVRTGDVPDDALFSAGCARVLNDLSELIALIPDEVTRCAG